MALLAPSVGHLVKPKPIVRLAPSSGLSITERPLVANLHITCRQHVAGFTQHFEFSRFFIYYSFSFFANRCFHFILGNFTTYDSGIALYWMKLNLIGTASLTSDDRLRLFRLSSNGNDITMWHGHWRSEPIDSDWGLEMKILYKNLYVRGGIDVCIFPTLHFTGAENRIYTENV